MSRTNRILFVTDAFGYGGAVKQIVTTAEGLSERGWQVGILNLNQDRRAGKGRMVDPKIQIYTADIPYRNTLQSNYELIKYTLTITKKYKPDIIVGFCEIANFCVATVGRLCNIPSVISERVDPFVTYSHARLSLRVKLWCINRATGAVFQTKQASEFYSKRLRKNSIVIPNPVVINEQLHSIDYRNMPKTVISLGRLDNCQKRFDVMLRAFSKFHKAHPDYVLKIYGGGPDEDKIRLWIKEMGMGSSVAMMGVTSQPLHEFCKGGIFLITSDYEGISNSLLEAMACGLPVVATDHTPGGARFLIRSKENGILVPVRDVEAISDALSNYANNLELCAKCGNNAKKVLSDFSLEKILNLWENYILKLMKK